MRQKIKRQKTFLIFSVVASFLFFCTHSMAQVNCSTPAWQIDFPVRGDADSEGTSALRAIDGSGSVEFWINAESLNTGSSLLDHWRSAGDYFWVRPFNGVLQTKLARDGGQVSSVSVTPSIGQWVHYVASWKNSEALRVYLNGVQVGEDSISDAPWRPMQGEMSFDFFNNVDMDVSYLKVFNSQLGTAEIEVRFNAGYGGACEQSNGNNESDIVRIKNLFGGRYHQAQGTQSGVVVETGTLNESDDSQQWQMIPSGNDYRFRNLETGLYLQPQENSAWKRLEAWTDNVDLQTWALEPVSATSYRLRYVPSGNQNLYMKTNSDQENSTIVLATWNAWRAQEFVIEAVANTGNGSSSSSSSSGGSVAVCYNGNKFLTCEFGQCASTQQTVIVNGDKNAFTAGLQELRQLNRSLPRVLVVQGPAVIDVSETTFNINVPGATADAPVWIKAEPPGSVVFNQFKSYSNGWRTEGGGIYSRTFNQHPVFILHKGEALQHFGAYDQGGWGLKYNTWKEKADTCSGKVRNGMGSGFTYQGGRVYIKLPGGQNPAGQNIEIGPGVNNHRSVSVTQSPQVILDGFVFKGTGSQALRGDPASHHMTVRNSQFLFARWAMALPDNSLVEWSEYSNGKWREVADAVIAVNPENVNNASYQYCLVKNHVNIDYRGYEGGFALSADNPGMENNRFRYNYIHDTVDGMALGMMDGSVAHHNVFEYQWDDHVQLEGGAINDGVDIHFHHNFLRNSATSAISHQDGRLKGPHYVYRNVVVDDAPNWGSANSLIKMNNTKTGNYYHYHNLYKKIKPSRRANWGLWVGNNAGVDLTLHLFNNIIVFSEPGRDPASLYYNGNINSRSNFVVDSQSHDVYEGIGGRTFSSINDFQWANPEDGNYRPTGNSVLLNAGINIPTNLPGYRSGDVGPFPEPNEISGPDWPRKACTQITEEFPENWPGE